MLPTDLRYDGIHFHLAPSATGKRDALIAQGQTIALPAGSYNRIYILAASADGDQPATFRAGSREMNETIQDWIGFVGQWFDRSFVVKPLEAPPAPDPNDTSDAAQRLRRLRAYIQAHGPMMLPHFASMKPGFIKRAPIAWFASHHHTAEGANTPYSYCYLFAYSFDLPPGARSLTLPQNDKIRIMAVTVANEDANVKAAQPLYDTTAEIDGDAAPPEN